MQIVVSTHSRLKAAGVSRAVSACGNFAVSTHSRLKAAGISTLKILKERDVSTHSRLKAAGLRCGLKPVSLGQFQHTAA